MNKSLLIGLALQLTMQAPAFAESKNTDANLFREIFAQVSGVKSAEQLNHLIYLPLPAMIDETGFADQRCAINPEANLAEVTARKMLCKMTSFYSLISPEKLFNTGATATAIQDGSNVDLPALTENLRSKELTIVILPGIFGEFIKGRAFEEIFPKKNASGSYDNDSAYAREWRAKLETATQTSIGSSSHCVKAASTASVCDGQEQLARLTLDPKNQGEENVPMEKLLNVGSIDDENGKPLVRVILFQMDGMTLESLSTQEKNAGIFMRRLEKFFAIMGTPKNIAFLGYSRGTDFALELVHQAQEQKKPWLQNVKGLVSLGGVVFGSALADEAISNPNSILNQQLKQVDTLQENLSYLKDFSKAPYQEPNLKYLALNTLAWWKFISAMAKIQNGNKSIGENLKANLENVLKMVRNTINNGGGADPGFAGELVVQESLKFGLFRAESLQEEFAELSAAANEFISTGRLAKAKQYVRARVPRSDGKIPNAYTEKYNTDIRRFVKLAQAAQTGVTELTTDSRLAWWRTHVVPTNIRYYSVSGTMADPTTKLGSNRWGYNPGSPDDDGLIQNWRDFQKVEISGEYKGVALNDSQVAIYKTMFWPNMIASLNPLNTGIRATPLAIFGTHHWGLALPIVTEVRGVGGSKEFGLLKVNPFPRAAVMKSIALAIANDIRVDEEKGN